MRRPPGVRVPHLPLLLLLGALACERPAPAAPPPPAASGVSPERAPAGLVRRRAALDQGGNVIRGPYLQMGGPTRATVRWRTDLPVAGRVVATAAGLPAAPTLEVTEPEPTTEHVLHLEGLTPDTRYDYRIGPPDHLPGPGDGPHFFVTAPAPGTPRATRVWVIGDSGTADANAFAVYSAYLGFNGARHTDLWLMLGDNAYPSGTDEQYQQAVFDLYTEMLPNTFLWPAIGNHETYFHGDGSAYRNIFTLPTRGEVGGLPSGSELYYSFDHANIHFVVLDSMISDRSARGPMLTWLRSDLATNNKTWLVALWHHPPYTKSNHDSDNLNGFDPELVQMRENVLPILEENGVDLVLGGHSHSYERTYLLDGHYGRSGSISDQMILDLGSGSPDDTGAYRKTSAARGGREGAVYAVAGSSGQVSPFLERHPAMYLSLLQLGSMVLDIEDRRLSATFLDSRGSIQDQFVIEKGVPAATVVPGRPRALTAIPGEGASVALNWTYLERDETGFLIERALEGEGFLPWRKLGANATGWIDARVPYDTRVWYRVRALNAAGESPASNEAGVHLVDPKSTDPGKPSVDAALPGWQPDRPDSAGVRAGGGGGCAIGGPREGPGPLLLIVVGMAAVVGAGRRGRARMPLAALVLLTAGAVRSPAHGHGALVDQLARLDAEIAAAPREAAGWQRRADLRRRLGQLDGALADLQTARTLRPGLPGLDLLVARTLIDAGRGGEAEAHLRRAVARPAEATRALELRAQWHLAQRRPAAAARDLERALTAQGSAATPDEHLRLARALLSAGAPERAARALLRGRRQLGPLASLDSAAIDLAVSQGRHDRALAILDQQIAASPAPAAWLLRKGQVLGAAGRVAAARRAYRAALNALDQLESGGRSTPALATIRTEAERGLAHPGAGRDGARMREVPAGRRREKKLCDPIGNRKKPKRCDDLLAAKIPG